MAHPGDIDTDIRCIGEHSSCHSSLAPRPGLTQVPISASAVTPQAKRLTGWEHSPTQQQTGYLKTKEPTSTSRHAPQTWAQVTRGPRPSSTHQWAGTGTSCQETCTSLQINLTCQGADTRSKKINDPTVQFRPYPGTSWALALPTSRPTQPSRHPSSHTQLCQKLHPLPKI